VLLDALPRVQFVLDGRDELLLLRLVFGLILAPGDHIEFFVQKGPLVQSGLSHGKGVEVVLHLLFRQFFHFGCWHFRKYGLVVLLPGELAGHESQVGGLHLEVVDAILGLHSVFVADVGDDLLHAQTDSEHGQLIACGGQLLSLAQDFEHRFGGLRELLGTGEHVVVVAGDQDSVHFGEFFLQLLVVQVLTNGNNFGSRLFHKLHIGFIDLLFLVILYVFRKIH